MDPLYVYNSEHIYPLYCSSHPKLDGRHPEDVVPGRIHAQLANESSPWQIYKRGDRPEILEPSICARELIGEREREMQCILSPERCRLDSSYIRSVQRTGSVVSHARRCTWVKRHRNSSSTRYYFAFHACRRRARFSILFYSSFFVAGSGLNAVARVANWF